LNVPSNSLGMSLLDAATPPPPPGWKSYPRLFRSWTERRASPRAGS